MLKTNNLTKSFGGLTAVNNVNIEIQKGSITAVIGPNGAGKTTFFNMITGVYTPTSGEILLGEESLVGLKPHAVSK
ncbi:ABC transporter ATP-binding protein, partial [Pseudomonas sp. GP01-A3]